YLDLARHAALWIDKQALQTAAMSTSMLLAAREALRIVVDEGLDTRWQRHHLASRALRAGLEAMGLELFGDSAHKVPMITLVRVRDGIDETAVRQTLSHEHTIKMMDAMRPLLGQVGGNCT